MTVTDFCCPPPSEEIHEDCPAQVPLRREHGTYQNPRQACAETSGLTPVDQSVTEGPADKEDGSVLQITRSAKETDSDVEMTFPETSPGEDWEDQRPQRELLVGLLSYRRRLNALPRKASGCLK